jgi:prefoldin subunit 5
VKLELEGRTSQLENSVEELQSESSSLQNTIAELESRNAELQSALNSSKNMNYIALGVALIAIIAVVVVKMQTSTG